LKSLVANPTVAWRERGFQWGYRNRRRFATGAAMMLAVFMGYFAVIGDNGLTVYKQKRIEDQRLARQTESLKAENERLQAHVQRLQNDPDAIEHEAREKLHYARPGEVIYTLEDKPDSNPAASAGGNAGTGSSASPGSRIHKVVRQAE
jgi:cell division protein FtsB